jgi:hypothetical protein
VVGLIVCSQTDFCIPSQRLEVIWLVKCEITLQLAIHDRCGGKVRSRLSNRGSDHIECVLKGVSGNSRQQLWIDWMSGYEVRLASQSLLVPSSRQGL